LRAGLLITLLLALAAGGVRAQEAPASTDSQPASVDPIGDAISAALPPDQSTDVEIKGEAEAVVSDPVPPVADRIDGGGL